MSNNIEIRYRYCKIELEQFAIFEDTCPDDLKDTDLRTAVQFSFDPEQHIICCCISVTLLHDSKILLKCQLNSYFDIDPESVDKAIRQDKLYIFDIPALIQFASLCYGSMRGVIYAKTMNTPFNMFILPPVYFSSMIDKPFIVEV